MSITSIPTSPLIKPKHYRPEIDGLRAVAVLSVVFFHIDLGFPGGYIGVDVFFVVSGYLITKIIVRELDENRFTFRDFYIRRIKRITPAVTVTTLAILIAGLMILDPTSLIKLTDSAIAQAFMISNIHFWRDAGYFSESAELKPLLHTWSLAIEEQFYIFYPALIYLIHKIWRRALLHTLVIIALISLCVSIIGTTIAPSANFFLLPSRAWELLAGGIVALLDDRWTTKKRVCEVLAWLGIIGIVTPIFRYTAYTPFPGVSALPPVVGTALFILANSHSLTSIGKILSSKVLVFIGIISYSLYLWHWPLIAFSKQLFVTSNLSISLGIFVVSLLLAYLSWRFIETPFRVSKRNLSWRGALQFLVGATLIVIATAVVFIKLKGLPERFDKTTLELSEDVRWRGGNYESPDGTTNPKNLGKTDSAAPLDFILWGDSHAAVLAEAADILAYKHDLRGGALITKGTPPVVGLWTPHLIRPNLKQVSANNQKRLEWILASGVKNLILIGRWDAMCEGTTDIEFTAHQTNHRLSTLVSNTEQGELSKEHATEALTEELTSMLKILRDAGVQIWLLKQIPETNRIDSARTFLVHHRFPKWNGEFPQSSITILDYQTRAARFDKICSNLKPIGVNIVDPSALFFDDTGRLLDSAESSFYRDDDHLSKSGADHFGENILAPVIDAIKATKLDSLSR